MDLGSLASIREFVAGWDRGRLDLPANNARAATVPCALTTDGFESQLGVNHSDASELVPTIVFAILGGLLAVVWISGVPHGSGAAGTITVR